VADWEFDSTTWLKPADEQSPTWGDYGTVLKAATEDVAGSLGALARSRGEMAPRGQITAEVGRYLQDYFGGAAEDARNGLTDSAKKRLEATFSSEDFWKHPISSMALKGTGMAPYLGAGAVSLLVPGGVVADSIAAGTIFGTLNAADVTKQIYDITDKMSDEDLRKQVPYYDSLREAMDEKTARSEYNKELLGLKPLLNFAVGAATGLLGPAGQFVRGAKGATGAVGAGEMGVLGRAGVGAAEGAGAMAAQAGTANISTQLASVDVGKQKDIDTEKLIEVVLSPETALGTVMGAGGGAAFKGHGKTPAKEPHLSEPTFEPKSTDELTTQPPKTGYGADSKPPPAEVKVGNKDSAPTRSEREYGKVPSVNAGATVGTVDAAGIGADTAAALKEKAGGGKAPTDMAGDVANATQTAPAPPVPPPAPRPADNPAAPVGGGSAPVAPAPQAPVPTPPPVTPKVTRGEPLNVKPVPTGDPHVDSVLGKFRTLIEGASVNRDHDVPYGAGASRGLDDPTIYVDRHFPREMEVSGVKYDPAVPFSIHENVEQQVMERLLARFRQKFGREPTDHDVKQIYQLAHLDFAEKAEDAWYRAHGIDPAEADKAYAPILAQIQHEKVANPPPDLYTKPYPHNDVHLARSEPVQDPETLKTEGKPAPQVPVSETTSPSTEAAMAQPVATPVTPTGRVLESQISPKYEAETKAANKQIKKQAKEVLAPKEEAEPFAKKGAAFKEKLASDEAAAKKIFDDHKPDDFVYPTSMKAKEKFLTRLRSINDAAEAAGIDVPEKVAGRGDHIVWLREVKDLLSKYSASGPIKAHIIDFVGRERAAYGGDFEVMRGERKAAGEMEKRAGQGDVETMAAPTAGTDLDRAENRVATSVSKSGRGAVRDARSEERPPSGEKLTPAAKAALMAQYNAKLKGEEVINKPKDKAFTDKDALQKKVDEYAERVAKGEIGEGVMRAQLNKYSPTEKQVDDAIAKARGKKEAVSGLARNINDVQRRAEKGNDPLVEEAKRRVAAVKERAAPEIRDSLREGGPLLRTEDSSEAVRPIATLEAKEILPHLKLESEGISGALGQFFRRRLMALAGDTPIHILSEKDMAKFTGDKVENGKGTTRGQHVLQMEGKRFIAVRADELKSPERLAHTVMHELAHAATTRALIEEPGLHGAVKQIMEEVTNHINTAATDLKGVFEYALKNPREFIAEAFSNPRVQEELSSIPVSAKLAARLKLGEVNKASVWDAIRGVVKQALAKMWGWDKAPDTMMDAVLRVSDKIATERTKEIIKEKVEGKPSPLNLRVDLGDGNYARQLSNNITDSLRIPEEVTSKVTDFLNNENRSARLRKIGRYLLTNDQYRQRAGDMEPSSRKVFDLVEKQGVRAQKLKQEGSRLIADMMKLQKKLPGEFQRWAEMVNSQTMYGVDASAKIGEGRNAYLELSKENKAKQAKGTLKPHDLPMSQWEAHAAHPWLSDAFKGLSSEFKGLQERLFKYFDDAQTDMTEAHINNILRVAGVPEADRPAKVKDIMATANRATLREKLLKDHDEVIADEILNAKKLSGKEGVYAPLMRHGDYVVSGKYKVKDPTNHVNKPDENTWEFKTREDAHKFAQGTGLHYDVDTAYYDSATGKRTTKADVTTAGNPEQRFAVKLQRQHTEFHETPEEAHAAAEALHKTGELEEKPSAREKEQFLGRDDEISAKSLATILKRLEQTREYQAGTAAQKAEMRKALQEASLVTMAGNRVQSRRIPRRRVEGASDDLNRNLWLYNESQANYRAKLEHRPQIEEAIQEMRDFEKKQHGDGDELRRSEIANEVEKRARAMDPNEYSGAYTDWTRRLMTWSYIDRMMRPSHLILHQTHLPMITAPFVAGRHGLGSTYAMMLKTWKRATGAYREGMEDFAKSIADSLHEGTDYNELFKKMFADEKDGKRLGKMFDTLADIGLIHPQAGLEVGKYMPSKQLGGVVGYLDRGLAKVDTVFRHATNATEAINRYVGAIMAYRLEFAKRMKEGVGEAKAHDLATEYARETLANTQGFYSATNAAPLFKQKWLRPFLQFRQFPQMMYHLLIKTATNVFKGATRQEKMQAAASLAAVLGTHTFMTGLLGGIPLEAGKVTGMVTKGLGLTDSDWNDFERWQYDQAVKVFGKEGADLVMHGAARKLFGVDVHHRLGLNSFFTFGLPEKLDNKEMGSFMFNATLGAPGGLVGDAWNGVKDMLHGNIAEGATKAFPLQMVRDIQKAWQGGSTKPEGYRYKGVGEIAARALGFSPSKEAEYYERKSELYNMKQDYTDHRNKLVKGWVDAKPGDKAAAWAAIVKWNAKQDPDSRITMSQLEDSKKRKDTAVTTGKRFMGVNLDKKTDFLRRRSEAIY
jgi:hypothetical protein